MMTDHPADVKPTFPAVLVGIAGGSGAGKTTFAKILAERLDELRCAVLSQDTYFLDHSQLVGGDRVLPRTHNHPRAVDWEAMRRDLEVLRAGGSMELRSARPRGASFPESLESVQVLLVEGHLIFSEPSIREMFSLKLYLDLDPHERVLRRIERTLKRGGNLEQAIAWYRHDVIPNTPTHTTDARLHADLVVPMLPMNPVVIDVIVAGITHLVRK